VIVDSNVDVPGVLRSVGPGNDFVVRYIQGEHSLRLFCASVKKQQARDCDIIEDMVRG
jgi:hypothetical protein